MKSTLIKAASAAALLLVSVGAYASNADCCDGLACCLKMLACCF